jgi:hypothetical protein
MATFELQKWSLPYLPGVEFPPSAKFLFDSRIRYNIPQSRIVRAIESIFDFMQLHYIEQSLFGRSSFQECCNKYAKFNLSPIWYDDKLANGSVAAEVAMDGLKELLLANAYDRADPTYFFYETLPSDFFENMDSVSGNPETSSLSVIVNPATLEKNDYLDASLFHAWLHRLGYRHPAGKYSFYFSGEAAMCMMRRNENKIPGFPANRYTAFLA